MSDIHYIVFALRDQWINSAPTLEMPYVRWHIYHYLGGVLEAESAALYGRYRPDELKRLCSKC